MKNGEKKRRGGGGAAALVVMNVKNRIATFEAQNDEVRKVTTPTRSSSAAPSFSTTTPTAAAASSSTAAASKAFVRHMRARSANAASSSTTPSTSPRSDAAAAAAMDPPGTTARLHHNNNHNNNNNMTKSKTTAAPATPANKNQNNKSNNNNNNHHLKTRSNSAQLSSVGSTLSADEFSTTRSSVAVTGTSSTMAASESRKSRLARAAVVTSSAASVVSEPPPGSLMERRKQLKESRLRQRSPVAIKNTSIGEAYSKRRNGSLTPRSSPSPSERMMREESSNYNKNHVNVFSTRNGSNNINHSNNSSAPAHPANSNSQRNQNSSTTSVPRGRPTTYLTMEAVTPPPTQQQQQRKQPPPSQQSLQQTSSQEQKQQREPPSQHSPPKLTQPQHSQPVLQSQPQHSLQQQQQHDTLQPIPQHRPLQQQQQQPKLQQQQQHLQQQPIPDLQKSRSRPTPTQGLHSHRRFVHSISAESDESTKSQDKIINSNASVASSSSLSKKHHPAQLAKKHRMQRMKRNIAGNNSHDMLLDLSNSMPSQEEYDDADYDTQEEGATTGLDNPPPIQRMHQIIMAGQQPGKSLRVDGFVPQPRIIDPAGGGSVGGGTDDEATLTSVRRVVMDHESVKEEYSTDLLRSGTAPEPRVPFPSKEEEEKGEPRRRASTISPKPSNRELFGEEKSEKPHVMLRSGSSSDYDSDHDAIPGRSYMDKQQQQQQHLQQQQQANEPQRQPPPPHMTMTPDWTDIPDVNGFFSRSRSSGFVHHSNSNPPEDEESNFDYEDQDQSPSSLSYGERQRREAERIKARQRAAVDKKDGLREEGLESPLLNKDDLEHYRQQMDNPAVKVAVGVAGCATLGCLTLGPVGLLLGAAAVGIGVGIMQIPEEQRNNMREKAAKAFESAQKSAMNASDTLSQSCAVSYKDSGVANHLPPDMSRCFTATEDPSRHADIIDEDDPDQSILDATSLTKVGKDGRPGGGLGAVGGVPLSSSTRGKTMSSSSTKAVNGADHRNATPPQSKLRNKKVACLRNARIIPVNQIHALDSSAQPKAWLDVLACATTTDDEKHEAMEEILILAKDKRRAKIFLEEGVLDSMMWILGRFFDKVNRKPTDVWLYPEITLQEASSAKLAASCCVTLGKAHCAAIHTEGDLLLMSLYERGTVPEERQLAQMLHEIPHHARVTKTNDPTIVDPTKEVFALKQLTLPQAEELARNIKALADGIPIKPYNNNTNVL